MAFRLPDTAELKALGAELGQPLDDAEAAALRAYLGPFEQAYAYLEGEPPELPAVRYATRSWRAPATGENGLGAWAARTHIAGQPTGPLAGRRVAVKDNIFVASVPLRNGADCLPGLVPEFDATVVTRLLDAGATITGKATCEYLSLSGGSATASTGFVRNPHDPAHSAGGSSSGSAALVVAGEADLALGCDQAGSIRIPASWCGAVGLKPTHGLVPYTGILGMEASCDHVGPITRTVADNALMLEVLAGRDGMDARQAGGEPERYMAGLGQSLAGLRIGVLSEGFDPAACAPDVAEGVRAAAERYGRLGAQVREVSVQLHGPGIAIWSGVFMDGVWRTLSASGLLFNVGGPDSPAAVRAFGAWQNRAAYAPVNVRLTMLFGRWLERYAGRYYAHARNLVPRLRRAYDEVLAECDLLLLPTTLVQASRLPDSPGEALDAHVMRDLFATSANTCQFDVTGHPALSLPCGQRNGLPVGMQLVGRPFEESVIYRAAHAFEQAFGQEH